MRIGFFSPHKRQAQRDPFAFAHKVQRPCFDGLWRKKKALKNIGMRHSQAPTERPTPGGHFLLANLQHYCGHLFFTVLRSGFPACAPATISYNFSAADSCTAFVFMVTINISRSTWDEVQSARCRPWNALYGKSALSSESASKIGLDAFSGSYLSKNGKKKGGTKKLEPGGQFAGDEIVHCSANANYWTGPGPLDPS